MRNIEAAAHTLPNIPVESQTDRQTDKRSDIQTDRETDRRKDEWMDGRTVERKEGRIVMQTDY